MKKLFFYYKLLLAPYRKQVYLAILALLVTTALQLIIPTIIQQVIDTGLARRDLAYLGWAGALILGVGLIRAFIYFWQRYLSAWVAQHVSYDLRNQLYDHIQHQPFTYHDHNSTGQLISRCIEDVRSTNEFTGTGIVELTSIILLIVGVTILLLITDAYLAIFALLPMIPLLIMTTRFGRRIGGLFLQIDHALGELSARLQENVAGVQVVRAFARESYEKERFAQANRKVYEARVRTLSQFATLFPTTQFLVTLGTILILWFGGQMVLRGELTIGELVAFNAYLLMMATPAQQLTWMVNMAGEASAGLERIFEVLDRQPEIATPREAVVLPPLSGRVEFRQVCFRYEGVGRAALQDIHLTVEPNQVIALIGPTGSGKTTLVNLIPRFYDVSEGAVLVDGYDVRTVDLVSLRQQIGIVLQTSLLFSESVAENIAFGRPHATDEEIVAAAKAAQAHDFILRLPEGYSTIVGERGLTLSGGQRQRIAIARALLMNPRILILDDSTSSVDTETEHLIQQALNRLMAGRTTFIIAHRLSTVRRADLILVMDQGRIVERGKHEELLALNGLYREIYELQLSKQHEMTESAIIRRNVEMTRAREALA
ncbi:MAG: ABC transporter ATP-binding protein [Anaerolineales bacterium]